jgi:succinylglutamate desuccinylase
MIARIIGSPLRTRLVLSAEVLIPLAVALAVGQATAPLDERQRNQVWAVYREILCAIDRIEPGLSAYCSLDQLDQVDAIAEHDQMTGCISDAEWDTYQWSTRTQGGEA